MKVFEALFLVSSVSQFLNFAHGTSSLPNLGSCTFKEYIIKMRSCTTEFFVNAISDPRGPCSPKVTALKDCLEKKLKTCVSKLNGNDTIRSILDTNYKEKTYCENAGIQFETLYPKVSAIPCSQIYFHEVKECYNETLKLWRANKADLKLCSEYSKAKQCDKSLIAAQCLVFHVEREVKELVELHYDNYNPFCVPTTHKKSVAWSVFHDGSFIISVVLCCLITGSV